MEEGLRTILRESFTKDCLTLEKVQGGTCFNVINQTPNKVVGVIVVIIRRRVDFIDNYHLFVKDLPGNVLRLY